jgi:hypothetical protein
MRILQVWPIELPAEIGGEGGLRRGLRRFGRRRGEAGGDSPPSTSGQGQRGHQQNNRASP